MPIEPPDNLPRPNPVQVVEFKQLFLKHKGVLLSDEEASKQARSLVSFVFLMQHAAPQLKKMKEEMEKASPQEPQED